MDHDLAQRFFEVAKEIEEINDKYMALLEEVKVTQKGFNLEWIMERKSGNSIGDYFSQLRFEGNLGWLGNMTPAEEYYY